MESVWSPQKTLVRSAYQKNRVQRPLCLDPLAQDPLSVGLFAVELSVNRCLWKNFERTANGNHEAEFLPQMRTPCRPGRVDFSSLVVDVQEKIDERVGVIHPTHAQDDAGMIAGQP